MLPARHRSLQGIGTAVIWRRWSGGWRTAASNSAQMNFFTIYSKKTAQNFLSIAKTSINDAKRTAKVARLRSPPNSHSDALVWDFRWMRK